MDKKLLSACFRTYGIEVIYRNFTNANLIDEIKDTTVIYTGQEDPGLFYKSFIEDIVLGLELQGTQVIPSYKYLRAYNNKVFMEILRKQLLPDTYQLKSNSFGCLEELVPFNEDIAYPYVVKTAEGAGSRGVFLAENWESLKKTCSRISRTTFIKDEIIDIARRLKHEGYKKISKNRKKFIIQEFIPNLENDWKVLVYYDKYFVLRRKNRAKDFRASGSGLFSFDDQVDPALLDAAKEIYTATKLPMISIDLAKSAKDVILIEMQFLSFGTSTLEKSPYYYIFIEGEWIQVHGKSVLEEEYARSISQYLG